MASVKGATSESDLELALREIALDRAAAHGLAASGCTVNLPSASDAVVRQFGDVVVKAHAIGTDRNDLHRRLDACRSDFLRPLYVQPLLEEPVCVGPRLVTVWPAGVPVDPARPDDAPWDKAAALLAALHRTPIANARFLPRATPTARLERSLRRLENLPGIPQEHVRAVVDAAATLPAGATRDATVTQPVIVHGDWHLGQLVRVPPRVDWQLIDIDDLSVGDPVWDLARPAAWFALGLLRPDEWGEFVDHYRRGRGAAISQDGDPWRELDSVARALTVYMAAQALIASGSAQREPDEIELLLLDSCRRIARIE